MSTDNDGCCKSCEKLADEIERLRRQLESEAYSTEEAINKRDAEIGRLRELLEDACRWHEQFPIQRVHKALGDNDAADHL